MPRYQGPELSFDVPRDWEDRTMVAYAAPLRPGQASAANLVMTRERLPAGETLASYVERHIEQLEQRLDRFALLSKQDHPVDGRPAVRIRFSSSGPNGRFEQHLTVIELPNRIVASLTMTTPQDDAGQMAPLFEHMLSTLQVEGKPEAKS